MLGTPGKSRNQNDNMELLKGSELKERQDSSPTRKMHEIKMLALKGASIRPLSMQLGGVGGLD